MLARASLLLSLFVCSSAVADGCKIAPSGRYIPEYEQQATIHWSDGVETLYVATRAAPTSDASLWIIPVRAEATGVTAEPVEEFPILGYEKSIKKAALDHLRDAVGYAAFLDSGGFCCMGAFKGGLACDEKKGPAGAEEVSRIEKLGLVVTVVKANTLTALRLYMDGQGVRHEGMEFDSLKPYLGPKYSFVCAWASGRAEPIEATGLKLVFPSPTIWFPMQASRAYKNPISTVVYVRDYVQPAPTCHLRDLRCSYVVGPEITTGVRDAFTQRFNPRYRDENKWERYTRVTVTNDPQAWHEDMELVPGPTPEGRLQLLLAQHGPLVFWAGMSLLGAALGWLIPLCTIPRAERRRYDYLAGCLIGAGIAFSLWCSGMLYVIWHGMRFYNHPRLSRVFLIMPLLGLAHFIIFFLLCAILNWVLTWQT